MPVDLEQFAADFSAAPVIAILRGVTPDTIVAVCRTLGEEDVKFVEVTLNSPEPFESIRRAADHFRGSDVYVGAGTVLRPDEVDQVAAAGGTYVVAPNFREVVVRRTKALGMVSVPGFFTPSEAFDAVEAGADFLKLFPARVVGPGFIKDLRAVLPTPVIAVGGISLDNVREYLEVAAGVGVGSSLYKAGKTLDEIRESARGFVAAMRG